MKEGTIILVSKPKKGKNIFETIYNNILPPLIRWFTKCEYHHVAIVVRREFTDELWVYEAVFHGFKPTYKLSDYLARVEKENIDIVMATPKELPQDFKQKLVDIIGTPYDFISLFLWQPIYQLTKRKNKAVWWGPLGDAAKLRTYCSEAVAYILGHEGWETWTAADFYDYYFNIPD